MLPTSSLDFDLPPDLIATHPSPKREDARLLVVRRDGSGSLEHRRVSDLPELLRPRDLLVLNQTRVLPARLEGYRSDTRGRVEGLFLMTTAGRAALWRCMLRGKSLHPGVRVRLVDREGLDSPHELELICKSEDHASWDVRVHSGEHSGSEGLEATAILSAVGRIPLPPYILKARRAMGEVMDAPEDRERYQTTFAAPHGSGDPILGAVAAPTAGLHLTPGLLGRLESLGVRNAGVTLHVGAGTFKPVETEYVEEHEMHSEWCQMPTETGAAIKECRESGEGRVICVGTTSVRTIESYAQALEGGSSPQWLSTRLLITPGYTWRWTDGLLTNFHLPRSTLLALVGALFEEGVPALLRVYSEAIRERYRFFSYGDAMLILP